MTSELTRIFFYFLVASIALRRLDDATLLYRRDGLDQSDKGTSPAVSTPSCGIYKVTSATSIHSDVTA